MEIQWSVDYDGLLGRSIEISFGRRLFKLHGAPAVIVLQRVVLLHTFRGDTEDYGEWTQDVSTTFYL